ncbi:MAG: glycosyltransferase family 2 protein, partial [Nitrospirae bacterium]
MLFPFGMESASLNHPTMSVCIPTRNRMEMLREAIESVLVQTFDDFELIISDNASTDRTEDVVGAFHDGRIRYVKLERDVGAIGNFNHCLGMARGRYVCILNDDDWMLPENLLQKARAL